MPHPNFVTVMPSTSRKVQRSRVSSGTSTVTVLPFTLSVVLMGPQPSRTGHELRERYATSAVASFELLLLPLRQSPSARCRKHAQIRQDRSARIGLCSLRAQSGQAMTPISTRGVAIWLMACAMLVYSVLVIGG